MDFFKDPPAEGMKVFINPKSKFAWQTVGSSYGIARGPITGSWTQVRWYNKKREFTYENAYRWDSDDGEDPDLFCVQSMSKQLEFFF